MTEPAIKVTVDQKALDRALKRIDAYSDRPLHKRALHAYLVGSRLMVGPMRSAAPRGATGNLRKSIAARANRLRAGEMAAATVGTRFRVAPHRHLVTGGTKPHKLTGVRKDGVFARFPDGNVRRFADFQHPGSKPNPFIDRVVRSMSDEVQAFITKQVLDIGAI